MPLDFACSPADASDLLLARRRLDEASTLLRSAAAEASVLADRTHWHTPSARRFHARVEDWRGELSHLAASIEAAGGDAGWLQVRMSVRGGGWC